LPNICIVQFTESEAIGRLHDTIFFASPASQDDY
jgi:hypothetical protein